MLPERLSTDLTSLNDGEDRLAIVIEMTVAARRLDRRLGHLPGPVRNRAKLAYDAVAAWLDGRVPMPPRMAQVAGVDAQVKLQDQAAARLRRLRHEQGALDLETQESRPVVVDGRVTDLKEERPNRAKQLIEDFMIAANGVTARFLAAHGLPSLRRVVRTPARWPRIVELAAGLGEKLPAHPDARALNGFLERRHQADPEGFPDLSLSVVKLLGPGEYVLDPPGGDPPGHFGLAVKDYTHATAPNRRYPDLITQRLVKSALAGGRRPTPTPSWASSPSTAPSRRTPPTRWSGRCASRRRPCCWRPHRRELRHHRHRRLGQGDLGAHHRHPFVEGRLERGFQGLDVGDRVRVRLVSTDVERGFIDFERDSPRHG